MRPVLEWYEDLPEPYRSQAIENYDGNVEFAGSQENAIAYGFLWKKTPQGQGFDYWFNISIRARRGEFDTPLTKLHSLIAVLEKRQKQFEEPLK